LLTPVKVSVTSIWYRTVDAPAEKNQNWLLRLQPSRTFSSSSKLELSKNQNKAELSATLSAT
jgi:hypothetical protein